MKAQSEADIQKAIVQYSKLIHVDQYLIYIPNEQIVFSASSKKKWGWWKKLLSMGYKKGTPDLLLAIPNLDYHGLWMEIKKPGNFASKEQMHFLKNMDSMGYLTKIVYDAETAVKIISSYLSNV